MYPKQHAVLSSTATLAAGTLAQLGTPELVLWTVIGTAVGVLIDVDHALLGMLVAGRVEKGRYWFRHPVTAVTDADRFLDDMEYNGLRTHRLVTHVLGFLSLLALLPVHRLVTPAAVGLGTHIVGDVLWDFRTVIQGHRTA